MNRLVLTAVLTLASLASADAFPWEGVTTLTDPKGQTLVWTLQRVDGAVRITGVHPKWQVEHLAKPDGTPVSTVRKAKGITTRVTYTAEGAQLERTDAKGKVTTSTIKEKNLWDSDTLDARLAGVAWNTTKKVRFKVADVDEAIGDVYPMIAEYVGEEKCGATQCHHVHLALDDFRRLFAPSYEYRYSTAVGAKYHQHDGDGLVFKSGP